ncbi:MAG: amidase family protein, partial [Sulfitobacter sp.]
GYLAAMSGPLKPLRIAMCDTTFDGAPVDPACQTAVQNTAHLLADLGHHVTPSRPRADHKGMMHAWTRIVACGTALGIRQAVAAQGRSLRAGDIQGVSASAVAFADTISGADYLAAVGVIHKYGREMAHAFADFDILLCPTMAEPPAKIGRFTHERDDYEDYRTGPGGVFEYSPFCASFNASGQPAATLPLHWTEGGLPVGVQLAAAFGNDEMLIALCAQIEWAQPWANKRASFRV